MVTHQVSKRGNVQPSQALRGSSDLHAWGDSNAYLQKQKKGGVLLTLEHRSAAAPEPFALELVSQPGHGAHLQIVNAEEEQDEEDASVQGFSVSAEADFANAIEVSRPKVPATQPAPEPVAAPVAPVVRIPTRPRSPQTPTDPLPNLIASVENVVRERDEAREAIRRIADILR